MISSVKSGGEGNLSSLGPLSLGGSYSVQSLTIVLRVYSKGGSVGAQVYDHSLPDVKMLLCHI